jgi:AraC-like DNA-binding protein
VPDSVPIYIHLRRAKDLIDSAYAQDLDIERLAREAHASPAHFIRSFKRAFGETPHKYLQRRRIERAMELLRETDLMVTTISIEVGFRSLGSFSSAFRDLVGEAPAEYARRWRAGRPPPIPACFTLMYTRPLGNRAVLEKRSGDSGASVPPKAIDGGHTDDHEALTHDDLGAGSG